MFRNNMVVSIKSNGKFFRENEESINIAFNSEYSIYIKNLESRDAIVNVLIDGKDVLDGKRLIVNGNSILELEGFMDGQTVKNKFKFIKRSKEIEDYRGILPEDGIISVTFDFESRNPEYYPYYPYYVYLPNWRFYPTFDIATYGSTTGTYSGNSATITLTGGNTLRGSSSSVLCSSVSDDGITVPGNDISQNFGLGYVGNLEKNPTTISFKLFGFDEEIQQNKIIFTKDKITCPSCGLQSKNVNRFCYRCGTRLLSK